MQLKHLFLSLLATATCRAAAVGGSELCGNEAPSEDFMQVLKDAAAEEASAALSGNVKRDTRSIKTYVHVIAASTSRSDGYLSLETVNAQMKVLNDNFYGTGYQFDLQNVSYTVDSRWSDIYTSSNLYNLKSYLRKGNYADLNLYYFRKIYDQNGRSLTGFCTYPDNNTSDNSWSVFYNDGCCLQAETTPGGSFKPFNLGKITTHEVGHWLGLIHPWGNGYSGGCTNGGDYVDDTPPQDKDVYGCNEYSDTCPGDKYYDPIHNYMGYADNACVNQFTNGQVTRMNTLFTKFRT